MDVFVRPTELLSSTDEPKLQEWWRYIAYGASLQCFQDRMDMESIQNIMPEFKKQEMLIQRRTIVQQTSQRSATIYTDDLGSKRSVWARMVFWWWQFLGSFNEEEKGPIGPSYLDKHEQTAM